MEYKFHLLFEDKRGWPLDMAISAEAAADAREREKKTKNRSQKKAAATLYIILLHFWGFGGVGDCRLRGIVIKIWPVFLSILEWESTSCSYIPC